MDCKPYGKVTSCTATYLFQLSALIARCRCYIPTMSTQLVLTVSNMNYIDGILAQDFAALSIDDQFYVNHLFWIKQLLALETELAPLPALQSTVASCLKSHNTLPSDNVVLATFQNLRCLMEGVIHLRNLTETTFYEILDRNPHQTEMKLTSMVMEVSAIGEMISISYISQIGRHHKLLEGKLPNISFSSFKTLAARQWLNDEVINYFVQKWCSKSSTLALSTFFACKILFEDIDNSCVHAKHGVLSLADEKRALKWCRRADVSCFPSILEIVR